MSRKKRRPEEADNSTSLDIKTSSNNNSNADTIKNQDIDATKNDNDNKQDNLKGRHFSYVIYPDSAPADWIEQLKNIGLAFVVSPLHNRDINADGTKKKDHWHIIVSWGNTTTYRAAKGLCNILNCPIPQMLRNCNGMYRYLTHKDNPEKHQYKEQPKCYNGWVRPLDNADVANIKREIWQMIYIEDCQEYGELLMMCEQRGPEFFEIASRNTLFFKSVCDGYRHNPIRTLRRRYETLDDEDDKRAIRSILARHHVMIDDETEEGDADATQEDS